jgi:hypothetical protein
MESLIFFDDQTPGIKRRGFTKLPTITHITCRPSKSQLDSGIINFPPARVCDIDTQGSRKICYPPFLEILNFCFEQHFSRIHLDGPGPMGLTALAVARILKVSVTGTYQNLLPEFSATLIEDELTEDLFWKYIQWFYNLLDRIYVYTSSDREILMQKGVSAEKIVILTPDSIAQRTASTERVSPSEADRIFQTSRKVRGAA